MLTVKELTWSSPDNKRKCTLVFNKKSDNETVFVPSVTGCCTVIIGADLTLTSVDACELQTHKCLLLSCY